MIFRFLTSSSLILAGAAVLLAACGSPASPTPPPGPSGATVTITSAGVSPRTVTVARGSRVTFVNNNNIVHEMASDPHPSHTGCPEINVGAIPAGQSRETQNLVTARTCNYHDHLRESNASLMGSIVVQ